MSKPTCRELLDGITHGVVTRGAAPDGISKDEALELASLLASRIERVLAEHPQDGFDGARKYCRGCFLPVPCPTVRLLDGAEP